MATGTNGAKASKQEEQDERRPTERVILEKIAALVIPAGADADQIRQAIELLHGKRAAKAGTIQCEAWREVSRQTGAKKAAITAYTGEPGKPDSKVGAFKAPGLIAWKGGLVLEAPPQPLVTARELDE